ncbi:hypothetical protein [Pseudolysinimonas sp.]|uniref:hypothetical protein n=1 Tax=Pseudolysinimonas sp. TaxID=2680009 RepID=UPI003F7F7F72
MKLSPRIAIVVAAILVVVAAAAVIAFVWAGNGPSVPSPSVTGGREAGPPTATPTRPALNPATPLLTSAPEPGSASGRLVTGFPDVAAPLEGSTVRSSSVAVDGARVQVAATAEVAATPAQVQAAYAERYAALRMTSAPGTAQPGTTVTEYSRSADRITITTSATAAGTELSIFGLFTVARR